VKSTLGEVYGDDLPDYISATMTWQPEMGPLQQLAGYLKDSLTPRDHLAQKNATQVSYWTFEDLIPGLLRRYQLC